MSENNRKVANKNSSRGSNDDGALDLPELGVGVGVGAAADHGIPLAASGRDAFNIKIHAEQRDEANQQVLQQDDDDDDDTLGSDSSTASTTASTAASEEDEDEDEEEDKDSKIPKGRKKRSKTTPEKETSLFVRSGYLFLMHMLCIAIYLLPILSPTNEQYHEGGEQLPVLDELHITQESNRDVNGETTLRTIFTNDYWGRPMHAAAR
jgi:hypothetical protein